MKGNAVRVSFPGEVEIAISGQTDGLPVTRSGPFSDNASLAAMCAAVACAELLRHAPRLGNVKLLADPRRDAEPGIR